LGRAVCRLFVLQPECRTRAQHQVEIGFHVAHDVGSRLEELLYQRGSLIITVGPKNGSLTVNALP
jgi:hypothetical protein